MPPALCCVPFLGTLASCFDWLVFEFWVLLVFVVRDSPAGTGPSLGPRVRAVLACQCRRRVLRGWLSYRDQGRHGLGWACHR